MSLFKDWKNQLENQTDDSFPAFWEKYSSGETRIYSAILESKNSTIKGCIEDLAQTYEVDDVIFMGFLDGINSSLLKPLSLEGLGKKDEISIDIDLEKLYFNMLLAKADYLYNLPQWDDLLTEEKRGQILKDYKKSKTVIKEKPPGRNDPCPCGSGKKYKKCCGA